MYPSIPKSSTDKAKVGIPCTVFEQDASRTQRPRDWNFGIYWAQSRLDDCLPPELKPLLHSCQTDPTYKPNAESVMPVHNGETGELLKNLPAPWSLRIHRRRWLKMLSNDIDIQVSMNDTRLSVDIFLSHN